MAESKDQSTNTENGGDDDFVFSPGAVGQWADQQAAGASPTDEGGLRMPGLEPIPMDVVEDELARAERGEEVSDAAISRIVTGGEESGASQLSAYERKEQKSKEKREKKKEEEDAEFESGSVNDSNMRKNKSCQTEMTRMATMRKEEKRQDARRSGTQPGLEGAFEGASDRHGVEIVQWDDLTKEKRRDLTRSSEGKFKKRRLCGDARRKRRDMLQRAAREEFSGSRRGKERKRRKKRL